MLENKKARSRLIITLKDLLKSIDIFMISSLTHVYTSFSLIIFFCSDLMNYLESVEDREGVGDGGGPPAANGALPILNRSPLNSK